MIIEFRLKNFKSIKEEAVISFLASADKSHPSNLIRKEGMGNDSLLKTAVFYGANASGKTNVIYGLNNMDKIIIESHNYQKGDPIPFEPFKLDEDHANGVTEYQITFIKNSVKFVYGFSNDDKRIHDEYLYHYPRGKKRIIFERTDTDQYRFTQEEGKQNFIKDRTPENVLYLSRATQLDYQGTAEAFEWFRFDLGMLGPGDHPLLKQMTSELIYSGNMKEKILNALKAADLGIDDIIIDRIDVEKIQNDLDKNLRTRSSEIDTYKIRTIHGGVPFDFNMEESEGTKRMYYLIGSIFEVLEKGGVLVLDDMDQRLHHLLNLFILDLFHDEGNRKSQLIFTTHDLNLLDQNIFRRDQIWFTEKDPDTGATDIFSLLEYHPRNDANIRKGYLAGRYGALPFVTSVE